MAFAPGHIPERLKYHTAIASQQHAIACDSRKKKTIQNDCNHYIDQRNHEYV